MSWPTQEVDQQLNEITSMATSKLADPSTILDAVNQRRAATPNDVGVASSMVAGAYTQAGLADNTEETWSGVIEGLDPAGGGGGGAAGRLRN